MLSLVALVLTAMPKEVVAFYLGGKNLPLTTGLAALFGSITIMSGFIAFPVAAALQRKGARLSFLFTYIGASGVCRIPMTLFKASFLGLEFTILRYAVAVPLIALSSEIMGSYLQKREYQIRM